MKAKVNADELRLNSLQQKIIKEHKSLKTLEVNKSSIHDHLREKENSKIRKQFGETVYLGILREQRE